MKEGCLRLKERQECCRMIMAKMMIQKVHIGMTDKTDRNTLTK